MGPLKSRRDFLCLTGSLAAGIALPAIPAAVHAAGGKEGKEKEFDVNLVEGLMREHGVLHRILLIYEEAASRISKAEELPSGVIADSAGMIRRFIEDYHEKIEEEVIFPGLEKKTRELSDLVKVLAEQHQAGRRLTDSILKSSETIKSAPVTAKTKPKEELPATTQQIYGGTPLIFKKDGTTIFSQKGPGTRHDLAPAMQQFIHMYRHHLAREDTVLFPAFRSIVSPGEFDDLGAKFEQREKELFGNEGFGKMVESIEQMEKKLGMYELAKFTPRA